MKLRFNSKSTTTGDNPKCNKCRGITLLCIPNEAITGYFKQNISGTRAPSKGRTSKFWGKGKAALI
jgi:hypothetical protein